MAASKAKLAQRRRRRTESKNKLLEEAKLFQKKENSRPTSISSNSQDLPIVIDDDFKDEEISAYQEEEIQAIDQANEMFQYIQAGIDDETSDDEALDSEDEHIQSFWPVFNKKSFPVTSLPASGHLKSGQCGYQKSI